MSRNVWIGLVVVLVVIIGIGWAVASSSASAQASRGSLTSTAITEPTDRVGAVGH